MKIGIQNRNAFPFSTSFPIIEHHAKNLLDAELGTIISGQHVGKRTFHKTTSDLLDEVSETKTGGKSIDDEIFPLEINDRDG